MDTNAHQTGQNPLIASEEPDYGSNGGNSFPLSTWFANVENNRMTTQTKEITTSAVVSQPSPHESSPRLAASTTTPGKGRTTTPSRRSRRQRTPSAKKKAYIETERIFSLKRKSPIQTAAKTPELTNNFMQKKTAEVEIATASPNKSTPPNARKSTATDTATGNEFVAACKEAFTSPYVSTVAQTAVTTKCGVGAPGSLSKTATNATKLSLDPVIPDLSPTSPDLMNADVLNTPSPASDVEDNLGLTLSETPEGFFADTDRSPRCTPPPKRTRVRTPFAKRPMDWSPLENEHTNQTVAPGSGTQPKNSSTVDTDKGSSRVINSNCSDSEKENLNQHYLVSDDGAPNLSQKQNPILDHNKTGDSACNKPISEEMLQVQETEHPKLSSPTMCSATIIRTTTPSTSLLLLRKQSTAAKTTHANLQSTSVATSSSSSFALSQEELPNVYGEMVPLVQSSTTSTSREIKNAHQPTEPSTKKQTDQTSLLAKGPPKQYRNMAPIVNPILSATASSSDQSNKSTVMPATKAVALPTASATTSLMPKLEQSLKVPAVPPLSEQQPTPPGNAQTYSQLQQEESLDAAALPYSRVTQGSQSGTGTKKSSSFVLPPLPTTKRLSVIKPKAKPMPENKAKLASTPQTSPATSNMHTTTPTSEPFRNAGITSTPVQQRTSPFLELSRASHSATPLRRSTRKASLLSACKIKRQLSATKSASIASMALEDPFRAMSSNGKTVKDSSGKCKPLAAAVSKVVLEQAKTSLEDGLNTNMERAKTTPYQRNSRRRSISSLATDSPTSTESSSVQASKKRCSNRRASISVLDTQLQTIVSQTQEGASGSIVFDDDQESGPKKRRTSRRASTSVLAAGNRGQTSESSKVLNRGQTSESSKAHASGGHHAPRLPPRQPRRASVSTASKPVGFEPDQDTHSFSKNVLQSSSTRRTTRRTSLSSTRRLTPLQDVKSKEINKASPVPLDFGETQTLAEQKHEESKVMAKPPGLEIQVPKPTTANLCIAGESKINLPFGNHMIVDAEHTQSSEKKQDSPLSGTKNEADKSESEFTPRRSARRKSMSSITSSTSSTKRSVSGTLRVLSSQAQNSSIKRRRLLSSTGKTTIKPFDLHTLREEEPRSTAVKLQHWMITKQAEQLFANNDAITRHPCVSARIFACYTLIHALQHSKSKAETLGSQVDWSIRVPTVIQPLMPLLTALVRVEMVSLEDQDGSPMNNTSRNRRVHFSGFDCSSTKPPVDARVGSHSHQQDCISALIFATQHISALTHFERSNLENEHSASLNIRQALTAMSSFLKNLSCNSYILQECAKSISDSYSPRRLGKAIDMYIHDFETILARLSDSSSREGHIATYLEWRLAEFVGQSIRFHLRRLFNPPPLPYTTPDEEALAAPRPPTPKQVALRQSRVYELIDLELPTTSRDSAVADGSVSSLFSIALSRIYDFFGMEAFVSALTTEGPISIPDSFCTSPSSMRGLGTKQDPVAPMTQDELEELLSEIDEVFNFLSAFKACKFLLELISVPGVRAEVAKMGGWSKVEHYAKIIRQHNLGSICIEDAHFSVLGYAGSMERFFSKIEDWLSDMEPKIPLAEISIQQLAKRYKTTTTSPKQLRALHRRFPHVKAIAAAIEEGKTRASSFPKVVMVGSCSESDGA